MAVVSGDEILVVRENNLRDHSAQLAPMIKEAMQEARLSYSDLSCVGVNGGPGSYTGLRIGLSTAKGICYAANVPLIMVDALTAYANALVAQQAIDDDALIVSTVENRRDELFYAVFDSRLKRLQDVTLTVASNDALMQRLGCNCVVVGSAINKLSYAVPPSNALKYAHVLASAVNLLKPVAALWTERKFADLAYSEPLYYKDVYIAGKT